MITEEKLQELEKENKEHLGIHFICDLIAEIRSLHTIVEAAVEHVTDPPWDTTCKLRCILREKGYLK